MMVDPSYLRFQFNLYGHTYHLIVERDKTHLRTKFVFDEKHDIKFCKPVERMGKQIQKVKFRNC